MTAVKVAVQLSSARSPRRHCAPREHLPMEAQSKIAELEKKIIEECDNLTWVTTGIFILSIFLTILRPDPTLAVCLFGFYGAHVRSYGAIRSFWFFTSVTIIVDVLWLLAYSPLRPIEWDTLQQLSRKDQVSRPAPQSCISCTRTRSHALHLHPHAFGCHGCAALRDALGAQPRLQSHRCLLSHKLADVVHKARGTYQADGAGGGPWRCAKQRSCHRDHEQRGAAR